MNIIEQLEREEVARLAKTIPDFEPGDTVIVNVRVKEGDRTRVQAYEGVCIARSGGGLNESFTVRKISYGEGVERVFPVHSPMIDSIKVVRRGKVRRAKLYYLRDRVGKAAKVKELLFGIGGGRTCARFPTTRPGFARGGFFITEKEAGAGAPGGGAAGMFTEVVMAGDNATSVGFAIVV